MVKLNNDITGTIAVWFSCGAASAIAAKLTLVKYPLADVRIINTPVAEEHEDNQRFARDVEKWLGQPIEIATNPKYASATDVWLKTRFMASPYGARCTLELKKEARRLWEEAHKPDWHVLGFTKDEQSRHDRFVISERPNVLPVLIEEGLTKQECFDMLLAAGISPSIMYALGYPNANCIGCVKATSPTYWNHVRRMHPFVFYKMARISRMLGVRLVRYKGVRIFLDELPADAHGQPMATMNFECGIFCEPERIKTGGP